MKKRIVISLSLFSLIIIFGAIVSNQEVFAKLFVEEPITSFEEYSFMTTKRERMETLNVETPKNKSKIWRRHIVYSADKMDLNKEQLAWVEEISNFINEDFFKAVTRTTEEEFIKTEMGKSYERIMDKSTMLLTPEQRKSFCYAPGDLSTLEDFNSEPISKSEASSTSFDGTACNCTSSVCRQCPDLYACESTGCSPYEGCGCFGAWPCVKTCVVDLDGDN